MRKIVRREVKDSLHSLKDLHPVLQRIYAARHVTSNDELSTSLDGLCSYTDLLDIDKAVERLIEAFRQQETIMVIGDFDADGATSTALAVSALRAFGGENISYLIPNRFAYGYGLTQEIVDVAKQKNPSLIITVDNGISSHTGVDRARALGIDVIITDHHLPGETLPAAVAVVNPNRQGDPFPSKAIAGVGVIFYLMLALRAKLNEMNWFELRGITSPNMARFLDYVALGTVADVVPLDKNNRILVHQGLRQIRALKAHPGILALLEISGRKREKLRAVDLGFAIGPRLNAAGRLDDMSLGVACLLAEDMAVAREIAIRLDDLNKERRVIETQMQQEAFIAVDKLAFQNKNPYALCLYQEDWHQGVVGLVASRVKERMNCPVIAFAKVDDNTLKGSARSIRGLHIRDVLETIAIHYPNVITKFGGHAMAAGLSLSLERYKDFEKAFEEQVRARLKEEDLEHRVWTDGELTRDCFTLDVASLLYEAGPWGQGFPEPLFDGRFKLINQRIVGQRHLKLVLRLPDSEDYLDAIAFNVNLEKWPNFHCEYVKIAFRLDINEYQERKKLQLLVEEIQVD